MSWRDILAESLGYPQPESDKLKIRGQTPTDKLDNMDAIEAERNSVHLVHSVHGVPGSTFAVEAPRTTPPELTPAECHEVQHWPLDTQLVFAALLDHMEGKGFPLAQAETLACATMQVMMRRRGGLIGFAKSSMLAEVAGSVEGTKEVFGDGVEVEWQPELTPEDAEQREKHAALVRCMDCQHFERGLGDRDNALGLCHGLPWDGHQGQWPKSQHPCRAYMDRPGGDGVGAENKLSSVDEQDPEQN